MKFKYLFVDEEPLLDRARWEVIAALRRAWLAQEDHLESLRAQGQLQTSRRGVAMAQLTRTLLQHLPALRPADLTTLAWCWQFAPQVLDALTNDLLVPQIAAENGQLAYQKAELARQQAQIGQQEQAHAALTATLAACRRQHADQMATYSATVNELLQQLTAQDARSHTLEMQLAQAERDQQALRQQIQTLNGIVFQQQEALNGRVA